jgi:hypothetical protein
MLLYIRGPDKETPSDNGIPYLLPNNSVPSLTPSSNFDRVAISMAFSNRLYGLPRLGRFLDLLSTVLRLFCTTCRCVELFEWAGEDGGRASDTAEGGRTADVALAALSSSPSSRASGSMIASSPFRLCVRLRPLPEPWWDAKGSWACFCCSSTSISRSLLSSCSSSVFWKVIDCRLQILQHLFEETFGDAPHFREISCDKESRVSLMRNASSSTAENDKAIVLAQYQRMYSRYEQITYDMGRLVGL